MNAAMIEKIMNMLGVVLIVALIALIWFIIWTALRYPIRMKETILKEREDARQDLLQIQAAKSVEWDKYKELQDETDRLRKAYFGEKDAVEKLKEERIKLQVDKDNLIKYNQELKKTKEPKASDTKKDDKKP